MTVRDERAAALIRRHRDLSDDFTRALPGLLDDLEAIAPTDAELTKWIRVHDREFAAWVAKQNRIHGGHWPPGADAPGTGQQPPPGPVPPVPVSDKTPKAPATRRRTAR